MKLSFEWLQEYVDLDVSAEELARGLTMSGSEVESITAQGADKIMSFEITSNRPDCLSVTGLAREASAVFDKPLRLPAAKINAKRTHKDHPEVECVIENAALCPRYTARVITAVKVEGSGEYFKDRLTAMGLRPVNNVVDITNYCLMEAGQPLHAFDMDKIRGNRIIVRPAKKGEKITTIDGVERKLEPGMLVIADSERPIAIAGVMGGLDTEVGEGTGNVLLESAYFDPISVRQTARRLGLSSESSYRFERGVDKGMIAKASDRAAEFIAKEAGGKIGKLYDAGGLKAKGARVKFDLQRAEKVLGISLDKKGVKNIFERLGMNVAKAEGGKMTVAVPTFREDLTREIDLIEEVARIHGYDKIPLTLGKMIPQVTRKERSRLVEERLRQVLPALGLNEIMTYSLISESAEERFSAISSRTVQLSNPLSEEQKVLTPQLVDGMLKAISYNINRKNRDLAFFEIGKIYARRGEKGAFLETPALCMALTGALLKNWREGERNADLFDLKGMVEDLFGDLKLGSVFEKKKVDGFTDCATVKIAQEKEASGFLGEAGNELLEAYDIAQPVFIAQLALGRVIEKAGLKDHYHSIPKFPMSTRDISVLCDKDLAAADVHEVITATGEEIVRRVELADVYEGEQIPAGKKSLTYSIEYGIDTRTLTDEEIEAVHSKIKEALVNKFDVAFR